MTERPTIEQLIESSSLGTAGAVNLRARTPSEARARYLESQVTDSERLTPTAAPTGIGSFTDVVNAARDGDMMATRSLVESMARLIWRATADFDLSTSDREDIMVATLLRLFDSLGSIRQPECLPGWVVTTARSAAIALVQSRPPLASPLASPHRGPSDASSQSDAMLQALRAGFQSLPRGCQEVLRLLSATPPISYADMAEVLGIPIGAVGPTRRRCLERLRKTPQVQALLNQWEPPAEPPGEVDRDVLRLMARGFKPGAIAQLLASPDAVVTRLDAQTEPEHDDGPGATPV